MSVKSSLNYSIAAAILYGMGTAPALAQDADEADARRLDPIVTTAQRVEQDAQDVPISITTVSDEKAGQFESGWR